MDDELLGRQNARDEARALYGMLCRGESTVKELREPIAVPPKIERVLLAYAEADPRDAHWIEARRKHLVLDLSEKDSPTSVSELLQLSPRVAAAYAHKTKRTLARDVNALMKMRLVFTSGKGVQARKGKILAFLPMVMRKGEELAEKDT